MTVAGAMALAAATAADAGPARAAGGFVTGVWWRAQSDGGTLPAPPTVSSHQLWVSSDPSGASAVSALHLDLASGERASGLTLHVAMLTTAPATPVGPLEAPLLACPTTSAWKPVDAATPGAWTAQPHYDCSKGQVQGAYSGDLKSVDFDLTPLAVSGVALDVALIPGLAPSPVPGPPAPLPVTPPGSGNQPPTFDATFNPPQPADVTVDTVAGTDTSEPDVSTALGGSVADSTAGSTTSPALDLPTILGPPIGSTAGVSRPLGPSVVNLPVATTRAVGPISSTSPRTRLLFGLVFADLMAWAWRVLSVDSRSRVAAANATVRRASLTLYDVPPAPVARVTARHFARTTREGRPPPLR